MNNNELTRTEIMSRMLDNPDKHGNEIHENGDIQFKVRDTSDLSKVEMMNFVDQIYRWSLEFLNVTLPAPNEQQSLPIN